MRDKEISTSSYVPIEDPSIVRRHLILGGIDAIKILEKYESLKKIRSEKRKMILDLKSKIMDLNESAESFKDSLPKINKRELIKETKEVKRRLETLQPKRSEGLKHLDKELNDLQEKLNSLNF